MRSRRPDVRIRTLAILIMLPVLLGGCKKAATKATTADNQAAGATSENAASTGEVDLSPEALESLVAPIALYPDAVLGQVLNASTNPQEVLDAGNWLLEHQDLKPRELNDEATKLGLTQSTRALLQFPDIMDMMCSKIDWTTALGAAFTADQAAVLDAVQRLRQQASDVGNLTSSEMMTVKTETEEGKTAITIAPAKPEVIYVPKYDPIAVYAPAPATIPPPTGVAATSGVVATTANAPTTTSTTTASSGSNTAVTGLLCFTAGVVIASAFSHNDDWYNCYPHYGYGGMYYHGHPYYPPPPYMYRPPYGGGYYPAHGYHPPANYNHNFNNNTININTGNNNYWGGSGNGGSGTGQRNTKSPITAAKPNRPELNQLNQQGKQRTQQAAARPAAKTGAASARPSASTKPAAVKGSYAGAEKARANNVAAARPATAGGATTSRPAASTANRAGAATANGATASRPSAPKASTGAVDRGYAGNKPDAGRSDAAVSAGGSTRPTAGTSASRPTASTPNVSSPSPSTASRPSSSSGGGSAFGGESSSGSSERAASQRGQASMSQGTSRASAGSGGGGSRRSR